ncbi:MAG: 2-oxoglutarate dehydrogenase complex dihydrolipoyllysine-residue succinyltransferase [Chlamydiales bacterium]
MKKEIKVPPLGESVSEGVVSNILKPNGAYVRADEEILELETDKVNQVLYAPATGVLSLGVSINQSVKTGDIIGSIETEAKEPPAALKEEPAKKVEAERPAPAKLPDSSNARVMGEEFVAELKTPPAQKIREMPPKEIKESVARPSSASQEKPSKAVIDETKVSRKRMSTLRRVIAQRLVEVKNTTAMLTTFNEIDMSAVIDIRTKEKENFAKRYGVRLGFMSFFVKAVVASLKAIPEVNSMIDGDEIVTFKSYDIGVAVSTEKGLMVPVLRECDKRSFGEIEKAIENYSKKARDGTIAVDDLRGGSFTITNGGVFGSLLSTPILNPPQSAILGMHTIVKRAVVVGDEIVIRPMMYVALSYDHRVVDGREAVLFLVQLKQILEEPAKLFLEA